MPGEYRLFLLRDRASEANVNRRGFGDEGSRRLAGKIGTMNYEDLITVEPGKRGGQPCIRGIRITVYDVLSYLASGMSEDEILSDFPDLTRADILACLSYAADRERKTKVSHG